MALEPKLLDPVQSLIDYTLEVKPYHTKIMEVLVEYVHTDYISVTMSDAIEFCFNLGYPSLNTIFEYLIVGVNNNLINVSGDVKHNINIGQRIQIAFSTTNDGFYYVTDITYDDITNLTTIQIRGSLSTNIISGSVVNSVIDHCGFAGGMLSTNVHELPSIECLGGYGNFYDSFLELVINVDLGNNELVIAGDHLIKFKGTHNVTLIDNSSSSQHIIDTIPDVNTFTILGDSTAEIIAGELAVIVSDDFLPIYLKERHSFTIDTVSYNGTFTTVTLLQPLPTVSIIGHVEFTEVVGVFQIVTIPGTDIFGDPILINQTRFDGVNTYVPVVNDIDSFPLFDITHTFRMLIQYIGYDDPFYCTTSDLDSEQLFVNMKEQFSLDISMTYSDNIHTYNWENTAQTGWDTVDFGTIDSLTEPLLPEQATAPFAPALLDLWYDTVTNRMMQWRNYAWVPLTVMYWYQEDPSDNQIVTYYKRIKNSFVDTGWLVFDPALNDLVSAPYDESGYSAEPYNIFHDNVNTDVDLVRNSITLYGGDYRSQLVDNRTITGYNSSGITQSTIIHDWYNLVGLDSSNRLKVIGDKTVFFVAGVTFGIESARLKHTDYNVVSSTFDGTYTLITVSESLVDINNNVLTDTDVVTGTIPALFYAQPNAFVEYDMTTVTIFAAAQPLVSDIDVVDYFYRGPYTLNITTYNTEGITATYGDELFMAEGIIPPTDTTATTFAEELLFSWGDVNEWFQYVILEIPTLDTLIVAGNALSDIQINLEIQIVGLVDNAGYYTVATVAFDGLNTVITLTTNVPTNTLGGYVESATILPMRLLFADNLTVSVNETPYAALVDAGDLIDSLDYKYFDIGGFDETLETIHLNDK